MVNRRVAKELETIETTIGELIAIITQIALDEGVPEEESYKLASLAVNEILQSKRKGRSGLSAHP